VQRAAEHVARAKRIIVMAGMGAVEAGAGPACRKLANKLDALLATTLPARGLFHDDPFSIGIADRCVYEEANRDFDGIEGLLSPMAALAPVGDPVPFPNKALNAGKTAPLKMRQLCGGVELRGGEIDPPAIIGMSEAELGELDVLSLNLNDDSDPEDLFFRWNESNKRWIFNMRTSELGTGVFNMRIRVAGGTEYVTGFELR
jgi:hypothetical protein